MLLVGLILCYLSGAAVLLSISRKYSIAELAGYSFLIGIGIETFFLFLLDVIGVKFSPVILIALNLLFTAGLVVLNLKKVKEFELEPNPKQFLQLKNINLPAIFIGCVIAFLVYNVTIKCLFWPPLDRDSLGSFDKLARVMAMEGKLKISLFDYKLEGAGGVYPPLYHAAMAYVYIFGAEMPKIITTLFFISTLLVLFDIIRRYTGATAAAFFTLLFAVTPEYFAHAALTLGNLPTTAYVCAGALCTFTWLDKREEKFFWLGAILMAFVVWVRSDTVVFTAAALLLMGIDFLQRRNWKQLLTYGAIAVAPFIIWSLYLKLKIHNVPSARFNFGIGFNSERWDVVKGYIDAYLFGNTYTYQGMGGVDGAQFFGIGLMLFFVLLLINLVVLIVRMVRKYSWKEEFAPQVRVAVFFFIWSVLYTLLFYFINEKEQASPLWSLMYSSFKRGMFCFIPIAVFYVATNYSTAWVVEKIEKFRNPS